MKKLTVRSIPALIVATLFAIGILVGRKVDLPFDVLFPAAIAMLLASFTMFILANTNPRLKPLSAILLVALILCAGAAAIQFELSTLPGLSIQTTRVVEIAGRIEEPPTRRENRTRFTLQAESMTDSSGVRGLDANILVTVIRRKRDTVDIGFPYGSLITLKGQIGRPQAERNPGEFDARKYYEAQGISFVMRVRGYDNVRFGDTTASSSPYTWLMKCVVVPVRSYMLTLIDNTIGGEEGELLKGIYIGERGGIPYATRTAFANSGISHILAVSGSNVVIVLVFFNMMFGLVRLPRKANIIATLIVVVFYMLLTGSQPPIVRATVMTLVFQLGRLFGEKSNSLNSLGVSALLIFGYDARQLYDVGFQLSFAAVLSLIYLHPIAKSWLPKIEGTSWSKKFLSNSLELAAATFVATIGTLPMIAVYFGRVSVVGLLTNIFVVPTVGASVMLGFVSSLFGWFSLFIADAFAASNVLLLKLSLWVAKHSGSLSWAYVDTLQFKPLHAIPFYAALGVVFHLHLKRIARNFMMLLVASLNLLLFVPASFLENSSEEKLRVSFIDVGQGDAALIEFPNGKTMLIDAGAKNEEYDSGERIVVPFLKRRGISVIDYLVASHPHGDHVGGLPYVFKTFDVKEVLESGQPARDPIYLEYADAVRSERCKVDTARAKDPPIQIGAARLYVLYPTPTFIDADTTHPHQNLNNTSVVFKLCFGRTSLLFMGDAEQEAEEEMVNLYGSFLQSEILKTGHHGSRTSSTQRFLDAVKPDRAIISVGLNNKFYHPSESLLGRLRMMNIETLRTDEEGAIVLESDGKQFQRIDWR